jgi:hypothetical protein
MKHLINFCPSTRMAFKIDIRCSESLLQGGRCLSAIDCS